MVIVEWLGHCMMGAFVLVVIVLGESVQVIDIMAQTEMISGGNRREWREL